jgi:phage nucleotide-binding protein
MRVISSKNIGQNSLKILVFGRSGAGKTTISATANEPTIVISAESGLLSISDKEVDVIELNTDDEGNPIPKEKRIDRLMEVYKYITSESCTKYKWLVIDSITEIGQNLLEKLQKDFPDRKDALPMWGEYSKQMRSIIKAFRDLNKFNVVMTALAVEHRDENGRLEICIDLNGKISDQMPQFFDEVFYLHVKKENDKIVRKLLCNPNDVVQVAKDRSGKLAQFEDPSLELIANKIRG